MSASSVCTVLFFVVIIIVVAFVIIVVRIVVAVVVLHAYIHLVTSQKTNMDFCPFFNSPILGNWVEWKKKSQVDHNNTQIKEEPKKKTRPVWINDGRGRKTEGKGKRREDLHSRLMNRIYSRVGLSFVYAIRIFINIFLKHVRLPAYHIHTCYTRSLVKKQKHVGIDPISHMNVFSSKSLFSCSCS